MPRARRKLSKSKLLQSKFRQVGFLLATTPDDWDDFITWFEGALKSDIKVTYLPPKGAFGDPNAIADAAKDLVKYCDVIVTASTAAALALKTATQGTNAQFVYASVGDPAASGLIPQSGGNFTGGSNGQADSTVVSQRVTHMLGNPSFKNKFAVVGDYTDPAHIKAMDAVYGALIAGGKQVVPLLSSSLTPGTNIDNFISSLKQQTVHSLYVCSDLWITANAKALNQSAHAAQMKTMFEFKEINQNSGGDDFDPKSWQSLFETAADYVDQILKGKRAGDLAMYALVKTKKRRGR
jgi:ABC-type uncharacterized transport system substrate-binding protein